MNLLHLDWEVYQLASEELMIRACIFGQLVLWKTEEITLLIIL